MIDREKFLYPNVIASTKAGDEPEFATFTEALTNNQETVIRTTVYWYIPGDGEEPVLMIEIDDEEDDPNHKDNMDVTVRIRRNDGLIYEGNRASQENIEETA